ncbi:MAG: basic amino acid ABC transporter substrate-binding protein [Firmicutes bacterium]|nr:basic amino acid ABC transporter substrate-binding protein [Bacillota bacterium]
MKLAKSLVMLCAVLVAALALAGCGGDSDVLRVGTEATFPPFEYTDEDDNIIGFDIDIINWIAEDNDWEIEVTHLPFDTLVESLAADQLDIVIAAMTIRPDRAEQVLFSDPYYDASQVMVVRDDETRRFGVDDIVDQDLIVAVQMGTTGAFEAEDILGAEDHPNLKQYRRANEAFMELKNGRVDLVIIDEPVALNYIAQLGGMKVHGEPFTDEQFGIAVQLENTEMMDKINASLAKMVNSGEYDRLFKLWFED